MTATKRTRRISTVGTVCALTLAAAVPALHQPAEAKGGPPFAESTSPALPLGPADLTEERTTRTLAPGVTHTHISRGDETAQLPWVVELSIPSTSTSPDPDAPARSVQDEASAAALVQRLDEAGFAARSEEVHQPAVADVTAGTIGHRVRLTEAFADKAAADAAVAELRAQGFSGRSWSTGWDGGSTAAGHWDVNVVRIDPRTFRGTLAGTYGPDLERRETTTQLSRLTGADVAVNAGFFVMDPRAGAEGDPAGIGVYDGRVASEAVSGRPALVLRDDARDTAVTRPTWQGSIRVGDRTLRLDGTNRVPGLIRNCGGDDTDSPTALPRHDVTCTDASELVTFSPQFGATTPTGVGTEVVLDAAGRVSRVLPTRGTTLREGERSVQGTGSLGTTLAGLEVGDRPQLRERVDIGTALSPRTTVINGGPQLVRDGAVHITQDRDGMRHVTNPSFDYGWVLQRNPRTFAGVDRQGRTVLVTVDGRQPDQLGLSIPETAQVAESLGLREAINLDGGGSTAMAVDHRLVTSPSDATGERAVGDAIVVR